MRCLVSCQRLWTAWFRRRKRFLGGHGVAGRGGALCTPVEMLRRVEALDELLGLRRPRGAVCGEGLAAQELGVVDAQRGGEDLLTQPVFRAGVVVPCLFRFNHQLVNWGAQLDNMI